ncbi:divalent-cation tolerance protein CutA [bacterium]|nr:divalent-cation tolerance protein CutA [bacterium]
MDIIVIYCTVPDKKTAEKIAKVLVKEKLAACVSVVDKVQSFFSWDGNLCDEKELLLMIKTKRTNFDKIRFLIEEQHPYNVPEIIAIPVVNCSEEYMRWLAHETDV